MKKHKERAWGHPSSRPYTELIHHDYEDRGDGGSGSAHGDGEDSPRLRGVTLYDANGRPILFGKQDKVGF